MQKIVAGIKFGDLNDAVRNLQSALIALLDRNVINLGSPQVNLAAAKALRIEMEHGRYDKATKEIILRVQKTRDIALSGDVDGATAEVLDGWLQELGLIDGVPIDGPPPPPPPPTPPVGPADTGADIEGLLYYADGVPADQITLRAYDLQPGKNDAPLGRAVVQTDGRFAFKINRPGLAVQLVIRAVPAGGAAELALMRVRPATLPVKDLKLLLPVAWRVDLADELSNLLAALKKAGLAIEQLPALKEDGERADLATLAVQTGWDARILAIAATAQQLSADTTLSLWTTYPLGRLGLAPDRAALLQIDAETLRTALQKARDAKLVTLTDAVITAAVRAQQVLAAKAALETQGGRGVSSMKEFLDSAKVSADERTRIEQALTGPWDSAAALWKQMAAAQVSAGTVERLQTQGQLATLTGNNARVVARLMDKIAKPEQVASLAAAGFYRPEDWAALLATVEPDEKLRSALLPTGYEGPDDKARLAAYCEDLARQVRTAFPSQVMAAQVRDGSLPVTQQAEPKQVADFLVAAAQDGYQTGRTPIGQFLAAKGDQYLGGLPAEQRKRTESALRSLHRLYQMSPDDESMSLLAKQGIDSAHDIVVRPESAFVGEFAPALGGDTQVAKLTAQRIYRKAEQIAGTTRAMVTGVMQAQSAPPMTVMIGNAGMSKPLRKTLTDALPTLGSLLGNQDYCDCQHCRSVLSPAAYFVDLLHFLDPGLPVAALAGGNRRAPFEILKDRRPDLPNLALTCANTLTAMPYIDLANEILENFIAANEQPSSIVHESGTLTTADLIAEPEFVIASVYDTLRTKIFPLTLPYDLWTQTIRAYCDRFELPLARLLALFRRNDALFSAANAAQYGRASVLAEELGLGDVDYRLLIGAGSAPYGLAALYGGNIAGLDNVATLTRALGITVTELTELIQLPFVNPAIAPLLALQRAGIVAEQLFRYSGANNYPALSAADRTDLETRLDALPAAVGQTARAWWTAAWAAGDMNSLLVIRRPSDGCDPALMQVVQVKDGQPIGELALLRLNVLVRLWRRLQWSLGELDAALTRFMPAAALANAAAFGAGLRSALVGLARLKSMAALGRGSESSRWPWLSLWGAMPAQGSASPYVRLILGTAPAALRAVFDHPLGSYLPVAGAPPLDVTHWPVLQAATGATVEDMVMILADLPENDPAPIDATKLSIDVVSKIYRYALLARGLRISVRELVSLRKLSGLNPFMPPVAGGLTDASPSTDDFAGEQTLRFVEYVQDILRAGIKADDVRYLLSDDPGNASRAAVRPEQSLAMLRLSGRELARAAAEHRLPERAEDVSSDFLRQQLGVVYNRTVVDTWIAMLDGSVGYQTRGDASTAALRLNPTDLEAFAELTLEFDAVRREQILRCTGVLSAARRQEILTARPTLQAVLQPLLDDLRAQPLRFYRDQLATDLEAAINNTAFFDGLFEPSGAGVVPTAADRRQTVAQRLIPVVREAARRRAVAGAAATLLGKTPDTVQAWMHDPALGIDPNGASFWPLEASLMRVAPRGLTVEYFAQPDLTGAAPSKVQDEPLVISTAELGLPKSARLSGVLAVPKSGLYRFEFQGAGPGQSCLFRLQDVIGSEFSGATSNAVPVVSGAAVELQADTLYRFTAEVRQLSADGGEFHVVSSADPALAGFSGLECWMVDAVRVGHEALGRLDRILLLTERLEVDDAETARFLQSPDAFGPGALARWPLAAAANSAALRSEFTQLVGMARYRLFRDDLECLGDDLSQVAAQSRQVVRDAVSVADARSKARLNLVARLASALRQPASAVSNTLTVLGFDSDANVPVTGAAAPFQVTFLRTLGFDDLLRLNEVLVAARRVGVSSADLARWATTNTTAALADDVRATMKGRYGVEDWRRAIQPIADPLRRQRRDALVQYLTDRLNLQSAEDLYSRFLIDPQMEPVVLTSRIRLAISSIQSFVRRCLMNQEADVVPAQIDADKWAWMRRYRVWEASRKILLFPENWLEPEFRDDASPLFKSMMGSLLQGDVDTDSVEAAVFGYLQGLEQIARLQIMTMYRDVRAGDETLHVIGRTYTTPHKYFYRRRVHGRDWRAWEPVRVDIEGDHLVAVMWRERLNLFWVTVVERTRDPAPASNNKFEDYRSRTVNDSDTKAHIDLEIRLNWSEYVNGEWQPREAANKETSILFQDTGAFDPRDLFMYVSRETQGSTDNGVKIQVRYLYSDFMAAFHVFSRFSAPDIVAADYVPVSGYAYTYAGQYTRYIGDLEVPLSAQFDVEALDGRAPGDMHSILGKTLDNRHFMVAPARSADADATQSARLDRPFFYEDHRNTFFVDPTISAVSLRDSPYGDLPNWWKKYRDRPPRQIPLPPVGPYDPRATGWKRPPLEDPSWGRDALVKPVLTDDWLTREGTRVRVGERWVGADQSWSNADVVRAAPAASLTKTPQMSMARELRGDLPVLNRNVMRVDGPGTTELTGALGGANRALGVTP